MAIKTNVTVASLGWIQPLQRNDHFLLDSNGFKNDYSAIVSYAETSSAAAVGQIIYAANDDLDGEHLAGLYVIKSYGEGAEVEAVGTGVAGSSAAITVSSYEDLEAACNGDNAGQIIILSEEVSNGDTENPKTYLPGLYVVGTGTDISALEKIATTSADGSSVEDQVSSLNSRVGSLETTVGSGVTGLVGRVSALESIGAQENVIEGIKVNGGAIINPVNKVVDIEIPAASEYTIVKDEDSGDYAAIYHLVKDGVAISGSDINIPKDMVVSSGSVVTKEEDGVWGGPGTYVELILANSTEDALYIPVDSLIKYVTGGATSEITVTVDPTTYVATANINAGSIAESKLDSTLRAKINGKVDHLIESASGDKAYIFNEVDGGGAKFEHHDGTESFIGVNNGGEFGLAAQIYVDKPNDQGGWTGSTMKFYHDKFYYENKENRSSGRPDDAFEIATKNDINVAVASVVKYDNATIKKNVNDQLYVNTAGLSVGGEDLGVVKNGGNIEINSDGEMYLIWSELI